MLEDFVGEDDILLGESCKDWEDAVMRGAQPLLQRGIIEPAYVEAIKANHRAMPYMVIAPCWPMRVPSAGHMVWGLRL